MDIPQTGPDDNIIIFHLALLVLSIGFLILLYSAEYAIMTLTQSDLGRIRAGKIRNGDRIIKLAGSREQVLRSLRAASSVVLLCVALFFVLASARLTGTDRQGTGSVLLLFILISFSILFARIVIPGFIAAGRVMTFLGVMAIPVDLIATLLSPLFRLPIGIMKRLAVQPEKGTEDLPEAFDLNSESLQEEEIILKGIVRFRNINVSEIMCPRVDVTAIDIEAGLKSVIPRIIESGFSRIPVFSGSIDNITGILYAKDILPYTDYPDSYEWQSLLKPAYFVPETKKISDLLKEFKVKKIHMAVVIDEFGGTSGIITLEDILEEIVGEISDESDEDTPLYRKLEENNYIFEGKILLNDLYKILEIEGDPFEKVRGESETLAGVILELKGEIPAKGDVIEYGKFIFRIEAADKRRIKEIRVTTLLNDAKNN